jgi:hypothetical protein
MKKIILSLVLVGMIGFMGCEKEPIPSPNPTVNLLVDEEPNAVVDSMGTIIFDDPMTSDITPITDATIMDYPLFLDYDPFTMVMSRTNKIDSCVKGIEVTKAEKELLSKAHLDKVECQKQNKIIVARINREIETWAKTQKYNYYVNWYMVEKSKIDYDLKMGVITEAQYKEKLMGLEKTWVSKMSYLNNQVKEKIKKNLDRATACGKIKDCEKEYLNKVLDILGKTRYKKWMECHKYNYKKK